MLDELIESGQQEIQVIVLKLGNEDYAVPITHVQEIIMTQEITRIPKSPSFVEGVINLRGHIIPVIDGKKKCFITEESDCPLEEKRIMVLEQEEEKIGLIVDSVAEVVHQKVSEIEPPPMDSNTGNDFIWGVGKFEEKLLILLNIKSLINFDENEEQMMEFVKMKDAIVQVSQ
jgi:purine-binding chemotaxis protein CheW